MSIKTFNAKNNKAKKGISPVIATVILVAVAVVIAAALAGFSSSLFGTYSSAGATVTVKSLTIDGSADTADVVLVNRGNVADEVVSIQAVPNPAVLAENFVGTPDVIAEANCEAVFSTGAGDLGTFTEGQVVTVKITMESGAILTQSVVVSP